MEPKHPPYSHFKLSAEVAAITKTVCVIGALIIVLLVLLNRTAKPQSSATAIALYSLLLDITSDTMSVYHPDQQNLDNYITALGYAACDLTTLQIEYNTTIDVSTDPDTGGQIKYQTHSTGTTIDTTARTLAYIRDSLRLNCQDRPAIIDTVEKLSELLQGTPPPPISVISSKANMPKPPGVYTLAAMTFALPKNHYTRAGAFSGIGPAISERIVVRGIGVGKTVIVCPNVCYFEANEFIRFENLTIQGAINSDHLKYWQFENVRHEDPNGVGWPSGILFKTSGAPEPWNGNPPKFASAGPIEWHNSSFEVGPQSKDTALDFVATQSVSITDSLFDNCGRGCLQAKGGSGVLDGYTIARNWIRSAGDRGIFMGGSTDRFRFWPRIQDAQAEFGAADIYDNIVEGGNSCFTVASVKGFIDFHHNLCLGQSITQFRYLTENEAPEILPIQRVTNRRNIMAQWTPPRWPSTNVLQFSQVGPRWVDFPTIVMQDLVFDYNAQVKYWGYPLNVDNGIVKEGILDKQAVTIERDQYGRPYAIGWDDYGPATRDIGGVQATSQQPLANSR